MKTHIHVTSIHQVVNRRHSNRVFILHSATQYPVSIELPPCSVEEHRCRMLAEVGTTTLLEELKTILINLCSVLVERHKLLQHYFAGQQVKGLDPSSALPNWGDADISK